MSFLIYPHQFDASHMYFGPTVKNNDTYDGNFSRIIYSTKHISFNGIGIVADLTGAKHEHHCKKTFMLFDPELPANATLVSQLQAIESEIVEKYVGSVVGDARRCVHALTDQLKSGCIKAYANDDSDANTTGTSKRNQLMLKICGVWETKEECGVLHKFIKC